MSGIFVNKDETIKINMWVGEGSNKKNRYWTRESDKPEGMISSTKYEVVFRKPNFRDSTMLLDLGIRMNTEGGMDLALNEIRYKRLEMLIKSWTLKDSDGESVPANSESIGSLNPSFAMTLAAALERELGIEEGSFEEEIENSEEKVNHDVPVVEVPATEVNTESTSINKAG